MAKRRYSSAIRLADKYRMMLPARGEVEFIIKDKRGRVIDRVIEPNIIKIFAKEILSHRMCPTEIWDPTAGTGSGAYVPSDVDPDEDFSVKYIMFGASFDGDGLPLDTTDTRFYNIDDVTGNSIPIRLEPGAHYEGGLINPVPVAEPDRPLKRIEGISFEPSYQPSGSPYTSSDVRAINNVVVFETTLQSDEYNGLGTTGSDYFTLTEVALVGGKQLDSIGACDCDPHTLFLEGSADGDAFKIAFTGGDVITIDASEDDADLVKIREGDQIKIVDLGDTAGDTVSLEQESAFYLVVSKSATGRELTLDRTPIDTNNTALTGTAGIFRDTMRIFSHRILKTPVKKSADFEITCRWRIFFA